MAMAASSVRPTKENWELLINKAQINLEHAQSILDRDERKHFGLAAFHMQQGVELAVKACIFRYGLDALILSKKLAHKLFEWSSPEHVILKGVREHLRKHKGLDWLYDKDVKVYRNPGNKEINIIKGPNFIWLMLYENERTIRITTQAVPIGKLFFVKDGNKLTVYAEDITLRNHYPILTMIEECVRYTKTAIDSQGPRMNATLRMIASQYQKMASQLIEYMRYANDPDGKVEVWKRSLGLPTNDEYTLNFVKKIEKFEQDKVQEKMISYIMKDFRRSVLKCVYRVVTLRRSHLINTTILPQTRAILKSHYFAEALADAFIDFYDNGKYESEVELFKKKRGDMMIFTSMFSPNGILNELEELDEFSDLIEFKEVVQTMKTFGKRYAWLGYVGAVSSILIFLYPHESISRYPIVTDDGDDSDSIYANKKDELFTLLVKSKEAYNLIKEVIEYKPIEREL